VVVQLQHGVKPSPLRGPFQCNHDIWTNVIWGPYARELRAFLRRQRKATFVTSQGRQFVPPESALTPRAPFMGGGDPRSHCEDKEADSQEGDLDRLADSLDLPSVRGGPFNRHQVPPRTTDDDDGGPPGYSQLFESQPCPPGGPSPSGSASTSELTVLLGADVVHLRTYQSASDVEGGDLSARVRASVAASFPHAVVVSSDVTPRLHPMTDDDIVRHLQGLMENPD
jgi:hypothetical protein